MSVLCEQKLKNLGFTCYKWEDEGEEVVDHVLAKGNVVIEITNLSKVEITTKGNYIELSKIDNTDKLEQLINLLS